MFPHRTDPSHPPGRPHPVRPKPTAALLGLPSGCSPPPDHKPCPPCRRRSPGVAETDPDRPRPTPTDARLTAALRMLGAAPDETGRWRAPPDRVVSVRDRALRREVADQPVTRTAMIAALVRAGYTYSYADGRAINTHPLIHRVAPPTAID